MTWIWPAYFVKAAYSGPKTNGQWIMCRETNPSCEEFIGFFESLAVGFVVASLGQCG